MCECLCVCVCVHVAGVCKYCAPCIVCQTLFNHLSPTAQRKTQRRTCVLIVADVNQQLDRLEATIQALSVRMSSIETDLIAGEENHQQETQSPIRTQNKLKAGFMVYLRNKGMSILARDVDKPTWYTGTAKEFEKDVNAFLSKERNQTYRYIRSTTAFVLAHDAELTREEMFPDGQLWGVDDSCLSGNNNVFNLHIWNERGTTEMRLTKAVVSTSLEKLDLFPEGEESVSQEMKRERVSTYLSKGFDTSTVPSGDDIEPSAVSTLLEDKERIKAIIRTVRQAGAAKPKKWSEKSGRKRPRGGGADYSTSRLSRAGLIYLLVRLRLKARGSALNDGCKVEEYPVSWADFNFCRKLACLFLAGEKFHSVGKGRRSGKRRKGLVSTIHLTTSHATSTSSSTSSTTTRGNNGGCGDAAEDDGVSLM